ncbi:Mobile element protein [Histomonas meleagridis]|uniref:Mobile element protein n=1 Tax=Histomonas meleagridis TaxID=135588 RepID=UPI00355A6F4C|nr:Mobile element protein [Histomonas meleagridis]
MRKKKRSDLNEDEVAHFAKQYMKALLNTPPEYILNMDETPWNYVFRRGFVLAERGKEEVDAKLPDDYRKTFTVIATISRSGNKYPPLFLAKGTTNQCHKQFSQMVSSASKYELWHAKAEPYANKPISQFQEEEDLANNASQETVSYIQGYKSDYHGAGYQRVAGVAKRKGFSATEWNVRKFFGEQNLFNYHKPPKKPNEHNSLFVARYAGQLWHADIHYVRIDDNQFYLLGFIDDRTRFLLHYEVLASKDSKLCSEALERALNKVQFRPKMLTIDNGGEFVGNPFQIVLSANGIEEFRTHPLYSPAEWEDRKILVYDRES